VDSQQGLASSSIEKVRQLMPIMPSNSLLEKSAQTLAEAWMRGENVMPDFFDSRFQSQMSLIFKLQIAIYLKGAQLFLWLRSQNGLESLAAEAWPDLFQKLLTVIFNEVDKVDQRVSIRNSLLYLLEDYQKIVRTSPDLQHTLHRLGLTHYFRQGKTHYEDNLQLFYYWYLEDRSPNFRGVLPMVYPMPFVLQSRWPKIKDYREAFYATNPSIQDKKKEWQLSVTAEEYKNENEGKSISPATSQKQKSLYEAYCEHYTPSERFMSCLSVMVRSQVNGSYPVVLVAALLSLIHPFYSGKSDSSYPSLRMFRVDIFWFLSRALCLFYAQLDLPLVCFFMAQQSMGPFPLLSDRMRLALCYQAIAVNYGHWFAAVKVYDEWCSKVPSSSWLYEELVFNHIVGLFWRMENLLVEMYINKILHQACSKECWQKHIQSHTWRLKAIKMKLLGAVYRTICQHAPQQKFRQNMDIVLYLCEVYEITIEKILHNNRGSHFDYKLKKIWEKLQNNTDFNTSRHLTPFIRSLPYYPASQYFWDNLIQNHVDNHKRLLQSFSLMDTPKTYADRLFSLVVNMLYHYNHDQPYFSVIQATLQAYQKSTAGRHYRIPLLRRLLQVNKDPVTHQLKASNNQAEHVHAGLTPAEISAVDMTQREIEAFAITARDSRNDFEHKDLSNDEKFIMYLKQRDPLMPAWIDMGLDCLRFTDCL
jgi:hypothetical protein